MSKGQVGRSVRGISSKLLLGSSSLTAVALLALPSAAQAQDQDRHWDVNVTNTGSGGTGTWDTSTNVWSPNGDGVSGPYVVPWDNAALDNAIFGGTAGTVTLGEPITVHDLTFNSAGYVLTGNQLTLGGVSPTITTSGGTTRIQSIIAGTAGLTKAGGGLLQLEGANTFSGGISLLGGTLYAMTDAALGAASNNITTAAGSDVTLRIDGAETARAVTIGDGGRLRLSGAGVGSALISGNGDVYVNPSNNATTIVRLTNDSNSYTGTTTFRGCNGTCSFYFSSIADLGEVSSLGAPTTVEDGTIIFNQSSQYSDSIIYTGTGHSSNRNWDLIGATAVIRNQGTGTLSITGDVDVSGGAVFSAEDAGFELLGTLSGDNYSFSAAAGQSITLGGSNTFTGRASVGGDVAVSTLADIGENSSFGTGSVVADISLTSGTVIYTGTGDASNRPWLANGATGILNDGSGALTLSGDFAFVAGNPNPDSLTLGGSFTGTNTFSGVISGAGNLISNGAGTWIVGGANTFTGSVTIEGGTLQAGNAAAFAGSSGFIVNGGTLDLGGFDLVAQSLSGTGGVVDLGANRLTVDAAGSQAYNGNITGSGGLTKIGAGTLTLGGANSYTGDTTISGGKLELDFASLSAPTSNIIDSNSTLNLAGGSLVVIGEADQANVQTFNGLNITAGSNRISAQSAGSGSVTINLGAVNRTGGLIDFDLPAAGNITTTNTSLGGWAMVNGTDYAKVVGGNIVAFEEADYTDQDDASLWGDGQYISDSDGDADSFFGTVGADVQLAGLQFTTADPTTTITIDPAATLGVDGAIIVASSVGANNQLITGGSITGSADGLLGILQNGSGRFTIDSTIVDNGGATGFTKGGTGIVRLTGANTYTGVTTLSSGTLEVNSLADGGLVSSVGASSSDSSNLVLEGGTFHYMGGADAVTDRGFTLVNGGAGAPAIQVDADRTVEFSGLVTSPDDAGLTKTGWGTLVLSNAANDYVGVTTVTGSGAGGASTLSVNTLADGGVASGIGAASSESGNLVLSQGGRLQYTGGTVDIDRGFTLASGTGRIDVAQAGTTLTIGGTAVGTGGLIKEGDGTLLLTGSNTYSGNTTVDGGTLRAGSAQAFGAATNYLTVNTGATAELGGFDITAAALVGGGTVDLGGNTLTTTGWSGVFTGLITGTGGFTRGAAGGVQTLTGCNNDYTGVTTIDGSISVDCLADGGLASSIGASSSDAANLVFISGGLSYTGADVVTDRGFTLQSGANTISVTDAGTTLEFEGTVIGGGALSKDGPGTLVLSGTNTYSGGTRVQGGTLRAGSNAAFGSGRMNLDNAAGVVLDLNNFDNSVSHLIGGGAAGGNVSLGDATLTFNLNSGSTAVYAGAISGTGSIVMNGGFTQQLGGCDSDYTGTTTITRGVLEVACLTDGGMASSIGASSADSANLLIDGGTLRYIGTGGSTDRQFTLGASTSSALDASGSGAIEFTYTGPIAFANADTAQTIALTGTSQHDNIFAAQLTDNGTGKTSLTKSGVGTWILTNPDSDYTGVTRINGGVLGVDKLSDGGLASSIGASTADASNLIIGNGSTLRYTGAGDTTDRLFTLAAGVTFIESSGTGAVVFTDTGPVTLAGNNQNRTIALGGTNTGNNTLAGSIGDAGTGVTTLAKNDSGTWVLTGENVYSGPTNINAGILYLGDGGTTGSITSANINNYGTLAFNRSDDVTYDGEIVGAGSVIQDGDGTTILTGTNTYTGGTTINAGTLQLGDGGTTGSIVGDVLNDGTLTFNRSNEYVFGGLISGTGDFQQIGTGTTILTADNTYTGGTTISAGTLQIGNGGTTGSILGDVANDGALVFDRSDDLAFGGVVSGTGTLTKLGAGTLTLTADSSYVGGTTISAGTLQIGDGGTSGSIAGNVINNGALAFNRSDDLSFAGVISGTGALTKLGAGTLTLAADNSYVGATTVTAGTLLVNGTQSGAGPTSVASGAALGGLGTIAGDVSIASGGTLTPGDGGVGELTIGGSLVMDSGSRLSFEFGEANVPGGLFNDLVTVGGDLSLTDVTIDVTVSAGGTFGPGLYRVFNYGGDLLDDGLGLGIMPTGSDVTIQTAVAGQINLINSAGLSLNFWDGDAGAKFNDLVDGGDGTWHVGGTDNNWTGVDGSVNAAYADGSFAIFAGTGGTVDVDNTDGAVTASGMQFASDGYVVTGDELTLIDPQSLIQVGDGSAGGAGFTATIDAELTGTAQLVKTDLGTLVLTGTNSYTDGTAINGGTLRISSDDNLGAAAGSLSFNGGTLNTTADIVSARDVALAGTGTFLTDSGTALALSGAITGPGGLAKDGAGTLVLTGDATHGGGTTIAAGTLQVGDGGTIGSLTGNVLNNAALVFNRSDDVTFDGSITGTGGVRQIGGGVLSLTADSSFGPLGVLNGEVQIANSNTVTATSTDISGPGATLAVTGPGSTLNGGVMNLVSGTGPSGTLNVENGGVVTASSVNVVNIGAAPGGVGTINISGVGSRLDATGPLVLSRTLTSSAYLNISDGAAVTSASLLFTTAFGPLTPPAEIAATVSGTGSSLDIANQISLAAGSLSVLDGATVNAASMGIAASPAPASLLVTGTGSAVTVDGDLTAGSNGGTANITLADAGRLSVGGTLTLGNTATSAGILNIGGAEGEGATAAGVLDAATLMLGAGDGRINFNHTDIAYDFGAAISGTGAINQVSGVTLLSGDSAGFSGLTSVSGGALYVNNVLGGDVTVATGGTLGGIGTIGGNVSVTDGVLNPGELGTAPGTLTIGGNLNLTPDSVINVNFGQANVVGGALNDLIEVGGDLVLGGTLNVEAAAGGSFDPGVYRVINYGGSLTNTIAIGTIPSPDFYVQTSIPGQVNLVNTAGLALRYWDGPIPADRNDGEVDGGTGIWQANAATLNDNWTEDGTANAPFADNAFAVFQGASGTVTVDNSLGAVSASGMQFLTDGYVIEGGAINLAGAPTSTIRVGDGTTAGAGITATIASELAGTTQLIKSDAGTLILTGANSYSGGTAINGGTLQIASDANLGAITGGLSFNGGTLQTTADMVGARTVDFVGEGAFLVDGATTLTMDGAMSGAGGFIKDGAGTLILTGTNSYAGATNIVAGTLFVNGDQTGAAGLTSVSTGATLGGTGTIGGGVSLASGAILAPGAGGVGTLTIGGDLVLDAGALLDFEFGEANVEGGALNDLVNVGGDLTLGGTINVTVPTGGTFGPGIYRVFNYGGDLLGGDLLLGTMPADSTVTVQTSVAGQVNLVNTAGLLLSFWDGEAGPKNNSLVDGGDGIWRVDGGTNDWTDMDGLVNGDYAQDTFAIFSAAPGTVTIDDVGGDVLASGMQFASDGYLITGDTLTLTGTAAIVQVGDSSTAGADYTATIDAVVAGSAQLVKTDAGTLILGGENTYTGGTAIDGGTLQIAADTNLGSADGDVTLNGGTLATTADLSSGRDVLLTGGGAISTAGGTTFTLNGLLSGAGALAKQGAGTLLLTGDNGAYTATTTVAAGTLAVEGILGSVVGVESGARLEGTGTVGDVDNAGIVAPGRGGIGTLTVAGAYTGSGGVLEIEAELGGDASPTDLLVVAGGTSGSTEVAVINRGGLGAQTSEGIKIIDVTGGASDGDFTLQGDYNFNGSPAIVAGAYGYRLYQGGASTPTDGDWYLRSALLNGAGEPETPLYQPAVSTYETYSQVLHTLNDLPTLQERVGDRRWASSADGYSNGIWGRIEAASFRPEARVSTTAADLDVDSWKVQMGIDRTLSEGDGGMLIAGLTAQYGEADAEVRSVFGNGKTEADSYSLGATLTWYGAQGLYADAQAQFSWFDARLESAVLGTLASANDGKGQAVGLEVGKSWGVGEGLTLTPQVQMTYQNVDFDTFADSFGTEVSSRKGDSLKTRWGVSIDHQNDWSDGGSTRRSHLYGLVSFSYEWLDGVRVDVSGTPISNANDRLWGELALGGSLGLGDGLTLYAEAAAETALEDFGDSYSVKGVAGLRLAF